jgi:hypothetical protein
MRNLILRIRTVLADFAHGIDAGNAIRHGLTPPRSHKGRANV